MMEYVIRPIEKAEISLLEEFLYQAIFQRDPDKPIPRSIIEQPEIKVYIENFGQADDNCLVAVVDNKVVGAVWTRILAGKVKGFGNLDDKTPEFAIAVCPAYRGKSIGTQLMQKMLALLTAKGYDKASLAVQKDNYAVTMYEQAGFKIVSVTEEEYIMVCQL